MTERTTPPFRADHVGSLLRTAPLKEARARREKNEISAAELKVAEDRAISAIISRQEDIGLRAATDGEFRRAFWNYDFLGELPGVEAYLGERKIKFQGVNPKPMMLRVTGKLGTFSGHPMLEHFKYVKYTVASDSLITMTGVRTFPAASVSNYPASCSMRTVPGGTEEKMVSVGPGEPTILAMPATMLPKGAPFSQVIQLALAVHELCEDIGLPSYPKTTGSTGIHILIPLGRQLTYEQSRMLGNLLARVIHDRHPEISTIQRMISSRDGKVYLDFLQNRHGQLMVAPFSVRPLPGAPVSMPITWKEVNDKLHNSQFTIKNAIPHMEKLGADPVRRALEEKPALTKALAKLAKRVEK